MKTNLSGFVRGRRVSTWLLSSFLIVVAGVPRLHAIAGVGDIVILAEDLTDSYKWPREQAQWNRIAILLEKQNEQQADQLRRMGDPGLAAARISGSVAGAIDAVSGILALQSCEQTVEKARTQDPLRRRVGLIGGSETAVSSTFPLFDRKESRDAARYEKYEVLVALQDRQSKTNSELDGVATSELDQQKSILKQLSSAKTQIEIDILHAAIAASQQRLELARMKADQARDERSLVSDQLTLELTRKHEAQSEVAGRMAEILRARALTSLQAQKDQNL